MTGSQMGRLILGILGMGAMMFGWYGGLALLAVGVVTILIFPGNWWLLSPACIMFILAGIGYLAFKFLEHIERQDIPSGIEPTVPFEVAKESLNAASRQVGDDNMVRWVLDGKEIARGWALDKGGYTVVVSHQGYTSVHFHGPDAELLWGLGTANLQWSLAQSDLSPNI
jgi:hypothetical protein